MPSVSALPASLIVSVCQFSITCLHVGLCHFDIFFFVDPFEVHSALSVLEDGNNVNRLSATPSSPEPPTCDWDYGQQTAMQTPGVTPAFSIDDSDVRPPASLHSTGGHSQANHNIDRTSIVTEATRGSRESAAAPALPPLAF